MSVRCRQSRDCSARYRPDKPDFPFICSQRVGCQIDIHRAGNRIGHNQHGRGQIICPHIGADAAFKIAVARQNGSDHQLVLVDGLRNAGGKRAGIADTGRAAIADQIKAQRVQRFLQTGFFQILGYDLRTGRQRGFHPWLDL